MRSLRVAVWRVVAAAPNVYAVSLCPTEPSLAAFATATRLASRLTAGGAVGDGGSSDEVGGVAASEATAAAAAVTVVVAGAWLGARSEWA